MLSTLESFQRRAYSLALRSVWKQTLLWPFSKVHVRAFIGGDVYLDRVVAQEMCQLIEDKRRKRPSLQLTLSNPWGMGNREWVTKELQFSVCKKASPCREQSAFTTSEQWWECPRDTGQCRGACFAAAAEGRALLASSAERSGDLLCAPQCTAAATPTSPWTLKSREQWQEAKKELSNPSSVTKASYQKDQHLQFNQEN